MRNENMEIYRYDITDSTNTRAKQEILKNIPLPALFIAGEQTNGRGRQGKSFFSPKNTGLYMTLALPPDYISNETVSITSVASVCVGDAIKDICNIDVKIKWINDLYVKGKKVCGILAERVCDPLTNEIKAVIIGVGINLSTKDFPEDLKASASSLFVNESLKETLAKRIAENLVNSKGKGKILMEKYRELSLILGKEICYIKNNQKFFGVAQSIDDNGYLKVEKSDGNTDILSSGEISVRLSKHE